LDDVLAQTRGLWEEVRGQDLFITGGTGFFGVWLLESFAHANDHLQLGARAIVLTRNPAAFMVRMPHLAGRHDLKLFAGNLRDFPFPSGRYPFVIHAANDADPKLAAKSPEASMEAMDRGLDRVLDFVAQAGTRKLLLTSSGAVYGRQPPDLGHLREDYPESPVPPMANNAQVYAAGKRVAERRCLSHARQFGYEAKVARCFAFLGPHLPLDGEFAAGNFIRAALRCEPIQIHGDGTPYRSYLYAADLAIWLWTILFRGQPARAYNVGSAQELTIKELAVRTTAAAGAGQAVIIAQPPVAGSAAARYVPAIDRARTELCLVPRISLETALHRTLRWYRSFPQ